MVYEELKALTAGAGEYAKDTGRSSLSAGQISVIGAASKLAASVVTYPSQVAFSLMTPDLASFVALPDVGICGAATNMQLRPALAKVALHCTHVTTGGTAGYISSSVLEFTSAVLPSEYRWKHGIPIAAQSRQHVSSFCAHSAMSCYGITFCVQAVIVTLVLGKI